MIYNDQTDYGLWEFVFDPMKVKPIPNPLTGATTGMAAGNQIGTPATQLGTPAGQGNNGGFGNTGGFGSAPGGIGGAPAAPGQFGAAPSIPPPPPQ